MTVYNPGDIGPLEESTPLLFALCTLTLGRDFTQYLISVQRAKIQTCKNEGYGAGPTENVGVSAMLDRLHYCSLTFLQQQYKSDTK